MTKKNTIKALLIVLGTIVPAGVMLYLLEYHASTISVNGWYIITIACILYYSWFVSVGIDKITN